MILSGSRNRSGDHGTGRRRVNCWTLVLCGVLSCAAIEASPAEDLAKGSDAEGIAFFERRVRPVLAERCYACHSSQSRKAEGGLVLDSVRGIASGSESGPILDAEALDTSLLLHVISATDESIRMPPEGERLTEAERADLVMWGRMGFPLPPATDGVDSIALKATTHWAFQPVARPAIPAVQQHAWVQSPIDAFVLAAQEEAGVAPALPADKRTLIRRATYDLIGLPPTPEEVAAFLADDSPEAFAGVVDRLLSSPHYGERWGRYWLDIARFATTDGPFAFTYRDYVIDAFNSDLPFDQFVTEQIAADHLDLGDDKGPLAALGFLTVGRQFMDSNDTIDDRIDIVTRGLMALSVSCARCHDHKYDPIPTEDYYALHGVFASSTVPSELPLLGVAPDPAEHQAYLAELEKRRGKLDAFMAEQTELVLEQHRGNIAECLLLSRQPEKIEELIQGEFGLSDRKILQTGAKRWLETLGRLNRETDPVFSPWFAFSSVADDVFAEEAASLSTAVAANRLSHPVHPVVANAFSGDPPVSIQDVAERYATLFTDVYRDMNGRGEEDASDSGVTDVWRTVFEDDGPGTLPRGVVPSLFPTSALMQLGPLKGAVDQLDGSHPGAPLRAMALVDQPHPHNSRVFIRGDARRLGEEVPRRFLECLTDGSAEPFTSGSGRLELARAIVSPDNPLTARVLVNRLWQQHFGVGLVATPDDFGLRSEPPRNPELLDFLAWSVVNGGWSIKSLHRLIMLSSVYQQASDGAQRGDSLDPENQLFTRWHRRRLDFESLRDTLLFVSEKLDTSLGGRPVAWGGQEQTPQPMASYRRTIYAVIDRNDVPSVFRVFDVPSPDLSASQREQTTVPQQALFFLNDPFVMQQACHLAARADYQLFATVEERIDYVYQHLFQRSPRAEEMDRAVRFLAEEEASPEEALASVAGGEARPLRAWERFVHVLLMSDELMFLD